MMCRRRLVVAAVAATLLLPAAIPAAAVDIVVSNFGFESGLSGWTQFGTGGNTTTTERAFAGVTSAKVVDTSGEDATGLDSTRLVASAGSGYVAQARAYVVAGRPDLYLRFYNSAGDLLSTNFSTATGPANQWNLVRTKATAPAGTARMSVIVYSSKGNTGTAYWDQVVLTRAGPTDLGVQVNNSAMIAATFGIDADQHHAYGVVNAPHTNAGMAARLARIDVNSGQATDLGAMPGALGSSTATTATDGTVYIGAYTNGRLYRYRPGTAGIIDVGVGIPGEEHIWALTSGPAGRVYGGTSDLTGKAPSGGYFTYRPGDGFANLGRPIWPDGQSYVRSIAFDPRAGQEASYLGLGYNKAALIRYDRATQQKVDILPVEYADAKGVGGLTFTGDRLFAQVDSAMVVLRVNRETSGAVTAVEEASFPAGNREVSPVADGKVYYTLGGRLHTYDIATRQVTALDATFRTKVSRYAWVALADQAAFPGRTLVAVGHLDGTASLLKYNPISGRALDVPVGGAPLLPNRITTIETGPDGRIYSGGYLNGGLGTYRPMLGHGDDSLPAPDLYRGIGQIDGMLSHNGTLYLAAYPSALLYRATPGTNPVPLPGLPTIGNEQDRPYAMTAGGGKLFIGTVAKAGQFGGALTAYDIATGASTVHRDIVADQSIVALAYHNGIVYGGSSIRPPLGSGDPRATEARLFTYHPATGATVEHRLPGPLKSITALLPVGGRIWGVADNSLFVFDPATNGLHTPPVEKFTNAPIPAWKNAELILTPVDSNHVYGTAGHQLFKIHKSTLAVTVLHTAEGMENLTVDEYGSLYYTAHDRLYRYGI
jgi:hypothetical protein